MAETTDHGEAARRVSSEAIDSRVDEAWLRPGGILLHIGARKTGSTALQSALASIRPELLELGILYPGRAISHNPACKHFWRQTSDKPWLELVDEVRLRSDRAVISSENLEKATPESVERIVLDLRPGAVQVVFSLRPLTQLLPSQWQNTVRLGGREPYGSWLDHSLRVAEMNRRKVWLRHDETVSRWSDVVGRENVLVVALGPQSLTVTDSFERIMGLRDGLLPEVRKNRSLTADGSEFLRLRNEAVHKSTVDEASFRWWPPELAAAVDRRVPGADESRLVLPHEFLDRVLSLQRTMIDNIVAGGVQVMGDLEEFTEPAAATKSAQHARTASDPSSATCIDLVGAELMADLQAGLWESYRDAERQRRKAERNRVDRVPARRLLREIQDRATSRLGIRHRAK